MAINLDNYFTMRISDKLEYPMYVNIELSYTLEDGEICLMVNMLDWDDFAFHFLVAPIVGDNGLVLMAWGPQAWDKPFTSTVYRILGREIFINREFYDDIIKWIGKLGDN